ncbi:hypothetical protein T10_7754 [Trichinella papuae]|uniref:Uncharacterized protein n=1 Tax=Trichinella papuae TaxID=268474 RepID=A0A0V1LYD5_9BILA|nr:hypothetical protein T10_7754 [Trichinella papuae]
MLSCCDATVELRCVAKPNNYVQMLTNVAHEIESACVVSRENGNRVYKEKTSSGN